MPLKGLVINALIMGQGALLHDKLLIHHKTQGLQIILILDKIGRIVTLKPVLQVLISEPH
jgi:hypothetical protein